jgi:pyruvate dehydrogenase E1 component
MFIDQEDVFFYLTVMNENYQHPDMPKEAEEGIVKGLYRFKKTSRPGKKHVNLMGSGTILLQAIKAAEMLKDDFGITADIWSATSFNELARDGQDALRERRMNPTAKKPREAYVSQALAGSKGPVVVATDYMKTYAEQIRAFVPQSFHVLGTDGFGRSDSRKALRRHFEMDAEHIAATAVYALFQEKAVTAADMKKAYKKYEIDPDKTNPRTA